VSGLTTGIFIGVAANGTSIITGTSLLTTATIVTGGMAIAIGAIVAAVTVPVVLSMWTRKG
jgi:hypothetical protein